MENLQAYLEEVKEKLVPAVVAYFVKDGQVLLGVRKKVSNGLGQGLVAGIGGKLEPGETSEEALVRELVEEVGTDSNGSVVCTPTKWENRGHVSFLFPHNPKWNYSVDVYVVTEWEGTPIETEPIKPIWYPIDQIPSERMWPDNAYWVGRVVGGKTVNGAFLYSENGEVIEQLWES